MNDWPWFLLETTNKTHNCDSEIISLVESNICDDWPGSKKLQRNHYVFCSYVGLYVQMPRSTRLGGGVTRQDHRE